MGQGFYTGFKGVEGFCQVSVTVTYFVVLRRLTKRLYMVLWACTRDWSGFLMLLWSVACAFFSVPAF